MFLYFIFGSGFGFQPLQLRSARLCGPVSEWPRITRPHWGGGVLRADQTAPGAVIGVAVSLDSAHVETPRSLGQVGEQSPELFVLTRDSKENGKRKNQKID